MSPSKPEERARKKIDVLLEGAGWVIQDRDSVNLSAGPGVAVCEFKMKSGHGYADYLPRRAANGHAPAKSAKLPGKSRRGKKAKV